MTDRPYRASFGLDGQSLAEEGEWITPDGYRLDVQTEAALAFLRRTREQPFFLYLAYYAPHVPLEAPAKYLDRFPGPMPERRRYALAMLSAIDDGVGRIAAYLRESDQEKNTLIFFTSDNGAPLRLDKPDRRPVNISSPDWDGSLNDPLAGEKGMLSEGGIRVPFLVSWQGTLPVGSVYEKPVSALDIAATALAAAGLPADPSLDGVDLVPYLSGEDTGRPHETLYWTFWNQRAIRKGDWKYIRAGARKYLFDLSHDEQEEANCIDDQLDIAQELEEDLNSWLENVRLPRAMPLNASERAWFDFHLPPLTE
jgi:arylsulfatase A-like enzyme